MRIGGRFIFLIPAVFLLVYTQLFFTKEESQAKQEVKLSFAPPVQFLQVLGHTYMQHIIADMLFIKVAVFFGGGHNTSASAESMAQHFLIMNKLSPKMLDFYYRTEAALADKGEKYTRTANEILEAGRVSLPEEAVLPFFEGFNYFYHLNDPLKAAKLLRIASGHGDEFQWLGHLASMLEAEAGSVRAGLVWLKGVHQSLENGPEKDRYARDIKDFEKAIIVESAIHKFSEKFGRFPDNLDELESKGLLLIPKLSKKFKYNYVKNKLSLVKNL